MQAAETKPIFDEKMKALAAAAKRADMQIPSELKKTPRIVEKSQLRRGMKGHAVFNRVRNVMELLDMTL